MAGSANPVASDTATVQMIQSLFMGVVSLSLLLLGERAADTVDSLSTRSHLSSDLSEIDHCGTPRGSSFTPPGGAPSNTLSSVLRQGLGTGPTPPRYVPPPHL